MSRHDESRALLASYSTGFLLSIGLTLLANFAVTEHWWSHGWLVFAVLALAVVQFAVQLLFFLHIGRERRPRWKLLMLVLAIIFVLIVVLGSIWIMYNLNHYMAPDKMNQYMQQQVDSGL